MLSDEVGSSMMMSFACLVQRLRDLDHLLLRDAKLVDRRAWVDVEVELGEQGSGAIVHLLPADHGTAHQLRAEEDVLGHGEVGDLVEFLVDGGDARDLGLAGVGEVDGLGRRR